MGKRKTQDEMVELKIGKKTYNQMVEYLLMIISGDIIFDEKNPGIRCKESELNKINDIKDEAQKDKTFINFEMTFEYFTFLNDVRRAGAEIAFDMILTSEKKHNAKKQLLAIASK
jgi:hypothetical protein